MMIAHSFKGEVFGPAQNMHGATFAVETTYGAQKLDNDGIVIDIGLAMNLLKEVLSKYNYKNLDELPQFKDVNTTAEVLSKVIWDDVCEKLNGRFEGTLKVKLHESHIAWASFKGNVTTKSK